MYKESEYLLLSGLQHLRFCPRQCALIYVESLWTENYLTSRGRVLHERVHGGSSESRRVVRTERDLKISSSRFGLSGRTDAVEFSKDGSVIPVEYKSGQPKNDRSDEIQLCAQALCLEEMLSCRIEEGALFYFKTRRRVPVLITDELKDETIRLASEFHALVDKGETPHAVYKSRCKACSFLDDCFPDTAGGGKNVSSYIKRNMPAWDKDA